MQLLYTTPQTATYPEHIVRAASALGFETEVKENLSLDELEQVTAKGNPVIVLGQAWRSRKESDIAVTEDWANGHAVQVDTDDQIHRPSAYRVTVAGYDRDTVEIDYRIEGIKRAGLTRFHLVSDGGDTSTP